MKQKKKDLHVRIDEELLRDMRIVLIYKDLTMTEWVKKTMQLFLSKQ